MKIGELNGCENKLALISTYDTYYVLIIDDVNEVRVLGRCVWNDIDGICDVIFSVHTYEEDYSDWEVIAIFDEFPKELLI